MISESEIILGLKRVEKNSSYPILFTENPNNILHNRSTITKTIDTILFISQQTYEFHQLSHSWFVCVFFFSVVGANPRFHIAFSYHGPGFPF